MEELIIPSFLLDASEPVLLPHLIPDSDPAPLSVLPPELEEKALLQDLMCCLVGGQGNYIRKDQKNHYKLECTVRDSVSSFINQSLQICNNYLAISIFSESHYQIKYGRVKHALCSALRIFLRDYTQQIAELESQPNLALAVVNAHLRPVQLLVQAAADVIDQTQSLHGTQIASTLFKMLSANRGIPQLRKFYSFLFESTVSPVMNWIQEWVHLGRLNDPQYEFFICITTQIDHELLTGPYEIAEKQIPTFFHHSMIDQIFHAGVAQSILAKSKHKQQMPPNPISFSDVQFGHFDSAPISKSLLTVFIQDHNMYQLFRVLYDVFLCQRGDLLSQFFQSSRFLMHRSRDQVDPKIFIPVLRQCYSKETTKYFEPLVDQFQINYRLLETHAIGDPSIKVQKTRTIYGKGLWEFFSLTPKVPEPLNLIITTPYQEKYTLLHRHIMMWCRLEYKFSKISKCRLLTKQISICRLLMHNFVLAYINYMSSDVINPVWDSFSKGMENATSVNSLISSHMHVLNQIMTGCFLLNIPIYKQISYVAQKCSNFLKELKKWTVSVASPATTEDTKIRLTEPLVMIFQTFQTRQVELLKELRNQAVKDSEMRYNDFTNRIENFVRCPIIKIQQE